VPRKVLAFRHVPFESLGMIADSLEEHDIAFEYVDLYCRAGSPDARAIDDHTARRRATADQLGGTDS